MMKSARALIVVLFLAIGTPALASTWRGINSGLPTTPSGVQQLVIHPVTRDMYAVASRGVFKSSDRGESWTALPISIGNLTLDPGAPSTLYVTNISGLMKSVDGGATWVRTGPPEVLYYSLDLLAVDPGDSSHLYLTGDSIHGTVQYTSADGGATWDVLSPPPGVTFNGAPVFTGGNSQKFYLAAVTNKSGPAGGIATTTNRGQSWTMVPIPAATYVSSFAIDPSKESVIYAAVGTGNTSGASQILKSTDSGKSWSALKNGLPPNSSFGSLVIDSADPSLIYAHYSGFGCGGCGGIVKSTDGGAHWTIIRGTGAEGVIYTFSLDPSVPGTIYAGTYQNLDGRGEMFRSADRGANWTGMNGPGLIDIHAMALNPVDSATIYASAGDSVFQSVDYGDDWAQLIAFRTPMVPPPFPLGQLPSGGPAIANALAVDFANPNVLYARTAHYNGCFYLENFLFKSTDAGASWTDSISPPASGCALTTAWDPPWMVMDPSDPATLYVGESFEGGSAVLKTSDGGSSWTNIWQLWTDDFPYAVHALAIDPSHNQTLYAGLSGSGGIFKSTDGGKTWSSDGLGGVAISALAIDPNNPDVLYTAIEGANPQPRGFRGLFKNTDGSAIWVEADQGLDGLLQNGAIVTAIVIDPSNSDTVYLGTAGAGVFRTLDGGAHWSPFNDGLGNLEVRVLLLGAGSPSTLYAGTAGGVFVVVCAQ